MKAAIRYFWRFCFPENVKNTNRKYPIKKALFEAWLVTLSQLNSQELEILKTKSRILKDKFIEQMETRQRFFIASISTSCQ